MHPFTRQILNEYGAHPANYVGMGAGAVTGTVGIADLAFGEDHIFNSGEFVQNGLVSHIAPAAGAMAGAALGGLGHVAGARMRGRSNRYPGGAGNQVVDMRQTKGGDYKADNRFKYTEEIDPAELGRALAMGGAAGAIGGAIPAIRYMANDSGPYEPITSLGQALSMKDKNELNALLDTHSSGPVF